MKLLFKTYKNKIRKMSILPRLYGNYHWMNFIANLILFQLSDRNCRHSGLYADFSILIFPSLFSIMKPI